MRGKAWKFEGLLDVDWEICSYLLVRQLAENGPVTEEMLAPHCFVNVDPEFPQKVAQGDFVVAGPNMGYGHDHDHASMALKGVGVAAVICESSAPYFLRNSIDHGLPVIEIPDAMAWIDQHDDVEIDLAGGMATNHSKGGERREFTPLPDFLLETLAAGGTYPLIRPQFAAGASS